MKIAFLEYYHKYRNTGDWNFVSAWINLLRRRHLIDTVQMCDLDESTLEGTKTINQVDINSYDLVIVNNLYESKKAYNRDGAFGLFLSYLKSIKTQKLFICHERATHKEFAENEEYNIRQIACRCNHILTYIPDFFRSHASVRHLDFDLFYKPIECSKEHLTNSLEQRSIDLLYLNTLAPRKQPKAFLDFVEKTRDIFDIIRFFGYYPGSGINRHDETNYNNIIANDTRVLFDVPKVEPLVKLDYGITDREEVAKTYADSVFSWQWTEPTDEGICKEQPWGLEGAALESLMYSCVPILPKSTENYIVLGRPLKDYNCCVFIEGPFDIEPIKEAVKNKDILMRECRKFSDNILQDSNRYINNISEYLTEIIQK